MVPVFGGVVVVGERPLRSIPADAVRGDRVVAPMVARVPTVLVRNVLRPLVSSSGLCLPWSLLSFVTRVQVFVLLPTDLGAKH